MAFIELNFVNSEPNAEPNLAKEIEVYINTDKLQDFASVAQYGPNCDAPEGTNTRISILVGYSVLVVYCKESVDEILDLIALANQKEHY